MSISVKLDELHATSCALHGVWTGKGGDCSVCKRIREQRRYEIARDVMAGLMADPSFNPTDFSDTAKWCINAADALLAALEESSDGE